MGFKDLKVFNQALLARQAWRLIAHPDSLCARGLKAKYYHGADLLDTAFIHNASPGWQGIMHGLKLLKKDVFGAFATEIVSAFGETIGSREET